MQCLKIVYGPDLAGGVTLKKILQVLVGDAGSVVFDMDQLFAGVLQMDLNAGGTRIKGILNAFFHNGGGSFDHFAGGDLIDDVRVELVNSGHGEQTLSKQQSKVGIQQKSPPGTPAGVAVYRVVGLG